MSALRAYELMRLLTLCFYRESAVPEVGVRVQARRKLAVALISPEKLLSGSIDTVIVV